MEMSNSAEAAVAELKAKQSKQAKWAKIGGILVAIAIVIRAASALFGSPELKTCDDSEITSSVTSIFQDSLKSQGMDAKVTGLADIKTLTRSDKAAMCSAKISFSDGSSTVTSYQVTPDKVMIKSTD